MKNLTAILLDEADVKDASAVMTSLNDEANDAAMAASIVVFRGQIVKNRFDSLTTATSTTATAVGATSRALPIFAPGFYPIAIGAAYAEGVYAGIVRGVDGAPDQHLLLIDGDVGGVIWDTACIWAESVGGSLPTRAEQAVLFGNLKDHFQRDWYWSSEQAGPSDAWGQNFLNGFQNYGNRSYEGRARAVRRLPI